MPAEGTDPDDPDTDGDLHLDARTNDDQRCDVEDILGAHAKIRGDEACCSRAPAPPGEHVPR